jgi:hypothetical protein
MSRSGCWQSSTYRCGRRSPRQMSQRLRCRCPMPKSWSLRSIDSRHALTGILSAFGLYALASRSPATELRATSYQLGAAKPPTDPSRLLKAISIPPAGRGVGAGEQTPRWRAAFARLDSIRRGSAPSARLPRRRASAAVDGRRCLPKAHAGPVDVDRKPRPVAPLPRWAVTQPDALPGPEGVQLHCRARDGVERARVVLLAAAPLRVALGRPSSICVRLPSGVCVSVTRSPFRSCVAMIDGHGKTLRPRPAGRRGAS